MHIVISIIQLKNHLIQMHLEVAQPPDAAGMQLLA
jgi:hypothetical protein